MEYDKIKAMLTSGDEAMKSLGENICRHRCRLKGMKDINKVILLFHSSDKKLVAHGVYILNRMPRKMSTLEKLNEHYKDFSHKGQIAVAECNSLYRDTKKLKGFFYTEKELMKLREEMGLRSWEPFPIIKNFKTNTNGKK